MTQVREHRVSLPIDVVWETLSDVDGWTEWFPTANEIRTTTGRSLGPGADYYINPDQGSMATHSILTVREVQPPRLLIFRIENVGKLTTALEALNREPNAYTHVYELESVLNDPSATLVRLTVDSEMSDGRRRLGGKFFKQDVAWETANAKAYLKGLVKYLNAGSGFVGQQPDVGTENGLLGSWQRFARLTTDPDRLRTADGHAEIRATLDGFMMDPGITAGHIDFILRLMCVYPPWLAERYSTGFSRRQALRALDNVAAWHREKEWLGGAAQVAAARLAGSLNDPDRQTAWHRLSALLQDGDAVAVEPHFDELLEVLLTFSRDRARYGDHVRLMCRAFVEWPEWVEAIADSDEHVASERAETDEDSALDQMVLSARRMTRSTLESAAQSYLRRRSGTDWWRSSARLIATMTSELDSGDLGDYDFRFSYLPLRMLGPAPGRPGFDHVAFEMTMLVEPSPRQTPPKSVAVSLDFDFDGADAYLTKVHPEETIDVIGEASRAHSDAARDMDSGGGTVSVRSLGFSAGFDARHMHSEGTVDSKSLRRKIEQLRVKSYAIDHSARWVFATTDHKAATGGFSVAVEAIVSNTARRGAIRGVVDVTGPPDAHFTADHEYLLREAQPEQTPNQPPPQLRQ